METRLTLRPGQSGTKKLLERFGERLVRVRAKRLGAVWRPTQKVWELKWGDAKRLGLADRVSDN
jgi:hypothetical protein